MAKIHTNTEHLSLPEYKQMDVKELEALLDKHIAGLEVLDKYLQSSQDFKYNVCMALVYNKKTENIGIITFSSVDRERLLCFYNDSNISYIEKDNDKKLYAPRQVYSDAEKHVPVDYFRGIYSLKYDTAIGIIDRAAMYTEAVSKLNHANTVALYQYESGCDRDRRGSTLLSVNFYKEDEDDGEKGIAYVGIENLMFLHGVVDVLEGKDNKNYASAELFAPLDEETKDFYAKHTNVLSLVEDNKKIYLPPIINSYIQFKRMFIELGGKYIAVKEEIRLPNNSL